VIFRNIHKALQCSITMQRTLKEYNADKPDEEKVLLCVGLGYGKMLRIGDADVFGAEVNAASKLGEDTAKAWEILVTEAFRAGAEGLPGISFEKIEADVPGTEKSWKVAYKL